MGLVEAAWSRTHLEIESHPPNSLDFKRSFPSNEKVKNWGSFRGGLLIHLMVVRSSPILHAIPTKALVFLLDYAEFFLSNPWLGRT